MARDDGERDGRDNGAGRASRNAKRTASPDGIAQVARRAVEQLGLLTGKEAEFVSRVERCDGGWRLSVEVVEVERIPDSTSVLGSYEVRTDGGGNLLEYARSRRYFRNQADQWEE
jgi:hypothetical protein